MMQKRTIYSLLLTSFVLAFAVTSAMSQSVTVGSAGVLRCVSSSVPISVDAGTDINALEIILEVQTTSGTGFLEGLTVTWDPGFTTLSNRIVKLDGVDGVSPDTVRIAALLDAGDQCLAAGVTQVATLGFTSSNDCDGTIEIVGATATCPNPDPGNPTSSGIVASTQFVECLTNALIPAAVTGGTVTITNATPSLATIPDTTAPWGTLLQVTAVGSDNDLANGCEKLTYGLVSPPSGMTINANSGLISWNIPGSAVCVNTIEVQVTDSCGALATTSFDVCVTNQPPVATCPADEINVLWGGTATGSASATDPDGGPSPMVFSMASFDGPGSVTVNPSTGAFSWVTAEDNSYIGTFTLCIQVTDGAATCDPCSPSNADTCCVTINVVPTFGLYIQKTHETIQGRNETVSIYLDSTIQPGNEMGGFDFLITYDASALNFLGADRGTLLDECGWEYFQYRFGANGNCGSGVCPSGVLRVVALAETNNGAAHPSCFSSSVNGQLASLNFYVTNDRTLECQYVPIRWIWYDCGDNTISSVTGDSLWISRYIYEFEDLAGTNSIDDPTADFPSLFGANEICDTALLDGKPDPLRIIDFWNGGIDIACAESLDARGDINLNEIAYEIADAVVFTNYFIYGFSAFTINMQGQIAATDVNADGLALSVADLVYLIRVVIGDANPFPKTTPVASVDVNYTLDQSGSLTVLDGAQIGALYAVVDGVANPTLNAEGMELRYNYDGTQTRVLVYSLAGNSFTGSALNLDGKLVSLEMATADGAPVNAANLPTNFALSQNYPNPFNPSTVISFSLPTRSEYSLSVYNVTGQVVATFAGVEEAGTVELVWDAGQLASGVYFYRLQAGNFTDTKKMVLLK
jgi:hypothetical protein